MADHEIPEDDNMFTQPTSVYFGDMVDSPSGTQPSTPRDQFIVGVETRGTGIQLTGGEKKEK